MTDEILREFEKEISAIITATIARRLKDLSQDLENDLMTRIAIEIYYLKHPLSEESAEGEKNE